MKSKFITIEGPEGSGKTSVIKAIVQSLLDKGHDIMTTREPGGIKISEQIREIILDIDKKEMDAKTEALLFAASRRQHVVEKIIPALKAGKIVLCDRYIDSSLAYQGVGRNLGIDTVYNLNLFAIETCIPDLTIFIDVPPEIGLKRVFSNGRNVDRLDLETMQFHKNVYKGYHTIIERFKDRIKVVDGTKPLETVIQETLKLIEAIL